MMPPQSNHPAMSPDLLGDIGLFPGQPCAITGSGGKTTLLWHLAALAGQNSRVLVSVTAKILPPPPGVCDRILLDPAAYDPADHPDHTIILVAGGRDERGKLTGIDEAAMKRLTHPEIYFIMEADGSRGLPLKMWHDHEPPVHPGTALTLGVIPVTALGRPVGPDTVYNWPAFSRLTGLDQGDAMTGEAFARLVLAPGGLFKNSPGRQVLVINQADDDELFAKALALADLIAGRDADHRLSAILCLSLKEAHHEDHRHYSCRRNLPADEPR